MSYKNLEYYDAYFSFLRGALEDLGYTVEAGDDEFIIHDKNGKTRQIGKLAICFLMGASIATIGKYLAKTEKQDGKRT